MTTSKECVSGGMPDSCVQCAVKEGILRCSRCTAARYCSTQCQKIHWLAHKVVCSTISSARSINKVVVCTATTLSELQNLIDSSSTPTDSVILLSNCCLNGDEENSTLTIAKPICIVGAGQGRSVLNGHVIIDTSAEPATSPTNSVVLCSLSLRNGLKVKDNHYNSVNLVDLHISLPYAKEKYYCRIPTDDDCVEINDGNTLIQSSHVHGGSDGLSFLGIGKLHIVKSEIRYATYCGVFANNCFIIEDSIVQDVGSYGMKTRGGAVRKGKNDIVPGPWDEVPGFPLL